MIFIQFAPLNSMKVGDIYEYEIQGTKHEVHFTVTGVKKLGGGKIIKIQSWILHRKKGLSNPFEAKIHISGNSKVLIALKANYSKYDLLHGKNISLTSLNPKRIMCTNIKYLFEKFKEDTRKVNFSTSGHKKITLRAKGFYYKKNKDRITVYFTPSHGAVMIKYYSPERGNNRLILKNVMR